MGIFKIRGVRRYDREMSLANEMFYLRERERRNVWRVCISTTLVFSFIRTDDAACDPCPSPPSPIITRHDETACYCRGFAARYYRVYALAPAETRGNSLLRPRRRSALTSFWLTRRERDGTPGPGGGEVVAPQRRGPESGRNVVSRLNRRPRVRPSRTDGLRRLCVSISSDSA